MHDNLESVGGARPQGVTLPIIAIRTFLQGSGQMKEERKSLLHLFLASNIYCRIWKQNSRTRETIFAGIALAQGEAQWEWMNKTIPEASQPGVKLGTVETWE